MSSKKFLSTKTGFRMPPSDTLAHICLDMIIKKSKEWNNIEPTELIMLTQHEYELIQAYRELKNRNNQQQNDRLTKKINTAEYTALQHSISTQLLYTNKYDNVDVKL